MKKLTLSLILGIMLIAMTGFVLAENCTDSDGGLDYFIKGELTADNITYEDTCTDSNFVKEYFCDNPPIYYDNYYCPNGCEDGACIVDNDTAICDSDNLDLCPDETNCTDATGFWYNDLCNEEEQDDDNNETDDDDNNETRTRRGLGQIIRRRVKAGVYTNEAGDQIRVSELAQNRFRFEFNGNHIESELEFEEETENNRTKFKVRLNNGRNAEIKIMPNVAFARALARLRLKRCNDTNINCSIKLKEIGQGNETRLVYEARARKLFKIWGFIKNHEEVRIRIDAETGEEIEIKRPWWAWMATESDEADEN